MKKITKLIVGTNNKGKLNEISNLLPKKIKIYSPFDFKIKSPVENGKTFKENSLIKAKFFYKKTNMTCLSDDSGLEIDILNGKPGIYSARWGGKKGDFNKAIKKVYKELSKKDKDWKIKKIKAKFICVLTLYGNDKILKSCKGIIAGHIAIDMKGKNGFGYDPIFIAKNKKKTFGELRPSVKFRIDHRYAAFKKIKKFF